jgi:predicted Zn-dependent peptidase
VPEVTPPPNPIRTVEYRERKQSAIAVAFPAVPVGHRDWPELRLLRNVTSGLAGTFFADLRGKRSLAYTVYAREVSRRDDGVFVGYLASDASKETEALEALVEKFRRLGDDGFTDGDVERAKAYLAGSTRIARQSNAAHVNELVEAWVFGLGLDFTERLLDEVERVTAEELRKVCVRYFQGTRYTTAIVSGTPD